MVDKRMRTRQGDTLHVSPVSFAEKEMLFEAGEPATGIYIIEAGEAEVFRWSGDRRVRIALLKRGDVIGELSAIEGGPHTRSVRAISNLDCLYIAPEHFAALLSATPPAVRMILKRIVRKLHATNDVAYGKGYKAAPDSKL